MPKYGYLVVEGPHDVEFAYRLLSPFGLSRVQYEKDLDPFFSLLVPRTFPYDGDLQKRVPVPLFVKSETHVIALHSAIGDSRLVATVEENANLIALQSLTGVGILLDTDKEIPAADRYAAIQAAMLRKGFTLPANAGEIAAGTPKLGAFVLPDNASTGNLEDLLLECGQSAYPELLQSATSHVNLAISLANKLKNDGEDLAKIPFRNKAIVGAIASVLRPGKAVQTSIQDNQWFKGDRLQLDKVKAVQDFLKNLFDLV
jgi:hypothetical protein